jgi:hypothetical protein
MPSPGPSLALKDLTACQFSGHKPNKVFIEIKSPVFTFRHAQGESRCFELSDPERSAASLRVEALLAKNLTPWIKNLSVNYVYA